MAKCPYCNTRAGFRIEEINTIGASGSKQAVMCCAGCDAVIHVFEARMQYYYGAGINEITKELREIKELLNPDKERRDK